MDEEILQMYKQLQNYQKMNDFLPLKNDNYWQTELHFKTLRCFGSSFKRICSHVIQFAVVIGLRIDDLIFVR